MEQMYYQRKLESGSRKFWRVVFGSMVGFILCNIIIFFLCLFVMLGIIASVATAPAPAVKSNTLLKINLNGNIEERGEDNPFENTAFESYGSTFAGLDDILNCINNAAKDPYIKGISIETGSALVAGAATLKEIRCALKKFKESGKFIYAYSETFSQKAYYLSSIADKVFLSNYGSVDLKGISFQLMFYKGLVDKLDVDIQVIRHGTFKSAVEPFILEKMSEANREQISFLVNDFWNVLATEISDSRNIPIQTLNNIANQLLCNNAIECVDLQLVDDIFYPIDYQNFLKEEMGVSTNDKLNTTTINAYKKLSGVKSKAENVAIIYAFGAIYDGKGNDRDIFSDNLCREIRKAYQNDKVRAIVLRINSGGGSASASEMIWHEIELAKAAGKIVVTSMGDFAASGGYYIACNSDFIFAQPNTLTGSIGVFGLIPSLQKMMKNKLGITFDVAKSHPHADYLSGIPRPLDELELRKLQAHIEEIYDLFTSHVAEGRNLPIDHVLRIGEGRVWSGIEAMKLNLVDELGNLEEAVAKAAELAELTQYGIICYPERKDFFTKYFNKWDSESKINQALQQQLGDLYFTYKGLKAITDGSGVQTRLPFEIMIND